jgi:hypothetical protein
LVIGSPQTQTRPSSHSLHRYPPYSSP